jgi:tetratricopeptide (TPR) repeat protein
MDRIHSGMSILLTSFIGKSGKADKGTADIMNFQAHYKLLYLVCTLFLLCTACSNNLEEATQNASLAEAQLAGGDIPNARISIQKAIAARDDISAYYILLGKIELQAQRPINAFDAFSSAMDLEPDNLEVLQAVADLGLQTGRLDQAETAADRLLLLAPNATGAMLIKGFIAVDENRLEDGKKIASEILTLNAQDTGGIILASRIDALQNNPAEALKKLDALGAQTASSDALDVTRLEIYRLQGNAAGMAELFPNILEKLPENMEYPYDYINLLYKIGDIKNARSLSLSMIAKTADKEAQLKKISRLWLEYDPSPLSTDEIANFAANGTAVTRTAFARHFLAANNPVIAQQLLSEMVAGGSVYTKALYARILLALGKKEDAYAMAGKVLMEDKKNDDALLVRSEQYLAAKQYEKALEDANIAATDAPENAAAHIALAKAYIALGHNIRARQIYERGIDILPQSMPLVESYRKFLATLGDKDRIISLSREFALASPSSIKAWNIFAASCSEFGDARCAGQVQRGLAIARKSYFIDEPPGTPRQRGLFARIAPDQNCNKTGGACPDVL